MQESSTSILGEGMRLLHWSEQRIDILGEAADKREGASNLVFLVFKPNQVGRHDFKRLKACIRSRSRAGEEHKAEQLIEQELSLEALRDLNQDPTHTRIVFAVFLYEVIELHTVFVPYHFTTQWFLCEDRCDLEKVDFFHIFFADSVKDSIKS